MARLVLVGTVHLDPGGYACTRQILKALKPAAVTVEVSEYAIRFRHERGPELFGRLLPFRLSDGTLPCGLQAVSAQLELPVEYRAATDHGSESGVPVALVGLSGLSRRLLRKMEREVLVPRNLERLARADLPALSVQVARRWAQARRQCLKGPLLGTEDRRRMVEVERLLAARIREHLTDGVNVHLGGWEHLKGLSELLSDLGPELRLASGAEVPRQTGGE